MGEQIICIPYQDPVSKWEHMKYRYITIYFCIYLCLQLHLSGQPSPPLPSFHLTARPWKPLRTTPSDYLDAIEGLVRVAAQFQDSSGAIIDPYLHREHQYSTPYFAYALGTLIDAGLCHDLIDAGVRAMDKSLNDFSAGYSHIPDAHGEFYIAAVAEALELYQPYISPLKYQHWKSLASTPLTTIMRDQTGRLNNWRTYTMKGEWLRAKKGLVDSISAITYIEYNWLNTTQRARIFNDTWNLYQDWSSDPQSHAVEAVGRGNLTSLSLNGYNGPSANEIRQLILRGGQTSLLLQSPTGQCPPNGRTDNHVFNDILYQLIFEALAEESLKQGQHRMAGQYRRAALQAFQSIQRWKRDDDLWRGSFYITKNHYDPGKRIGYQPASQWGNYSGAMMFHLAEAYRTHISEIPQQPTPTEIGGYVLTTDPRFSTFVANAGGMQVFVNLRGDDVPKYDTYWSPLGVVRFSRTNWDDRLGPSDGGRQYLSNDEKEGLSLTAYGTGVSFGPTWEYRGQWIRMADMARHYRAIVHTEFVHPLLVKFKLYYTYITGVGGPYFEQIFTVTPDGIFSQLKCLQKRDIGLTIPLLIDDGLPLNYQIHDGIASTHYPDSSDRQHFISLNSHNDIYTQDEPIISTYGDLLPLRFTTADTSLNVFIYPAHSNDPSARTFKDSFTLTEAGFTSILGRVEHNMYIGRFSAGGEGNSIDLDDDGEDDVIFDTECQFMLQLTQGNISAVEVDREVIMKYKGTTYKLKAFEPVFRKE